MKDNIFNFSLRIALLIIFIFTSIGDVMSAESSALSYPALRPLAYRRSGPEPILPNSGDAKRESDNGRKEPGELSDEERLIKAEYIYRDKESNLILLSEASDILLDYIYSGDEHLQQRATDILKTRDNLFVIRQKPEKKHKHGSTDYTAGTIPAKKKFEDMVRAGDIEPVVIVNIKKVYPRIELAYAEEMRRISRYYNGNVTFILKVEGPGEFPADLPGVTKALHDTIDILRRDFDKTFTIQIADGGFKTRLGPISLRYHKEGLIPYHRNISELQEVFTRAGRTIMQLPNKGVGDHIICASDTLLEPRTLHLDRSGDRGLQIPAVERPEAILDQDIDAALFLFIDEEPVGRIDDITVERTKELLKKHRTAYINQLYYLAVWKKESLSEYMKLAYSTYMENGRPMAHAPVNMHWEFTRSVFHTPEGWAQYHYDNNITKMTIEDWAGLRELAIEFLGKKAERVNFVNGKARDEGRFEQLIARFRKPFRALNRVKKDPGIILGNASEAWLDHVVIRGKRGKVIFGGPNVRLRNVIIELKEGETLYIPDGWIIKDSYIGKNTFEEGGGLLIGATLYEEDKLHPLRDKVFKSNTCNSVISRLDKKPLYISARFDTPTIIKAGGRNYEFEEIQWQVNAAENRRALYLLQETLNQEFDGIPRIFPLNIKTYKRLISRPIEKRIHDLAVEIIRRQEEQGGGQHDVYIEGIQGTDKTFFAKRLAQSLKAQGKNVVLLDEKWYRKSQEEMENLRKNKPGEWKRHSENWYRWDKLQKDFERIRKTRSDRIVLKDLYRQSTGRCDLKKPIDVTPDTIFIYTGFYTQDITKFYGWDVTDLSILPFRPSTRIYLGLSQADSLELKLERDKKWLDEKEIRFLDKEVFVPAFRRYISAYDPASYSDYVFRIDTEDPRAITEVRPYTRLWRERSSKEDNPPAVKNAVIFGAGAIGRGLFAFNFRRSGYNIFFIDANEKLTERLIEKEQYEIRHLRTLPKSHLKKGAPKEDRHRHYVDRVTATLQDEIEEIEEQVFKADAICLAVPDANLSEVSALLGRCLQKRILRGNTNPINVFLSTNKLKASKYVEGLILKGIPEKNRKQFRRQLRKHIGIVETMVEGITRLGTKKQRQIGSTTVYGDSFSRLIVDEKRFKGPEPDIVGMSLAKDMGTDITREKQRRLFLFESAYSFIAYLGYLRGYTYIHEAWADPWIKNETEKLLRIVSEAFIKKYGFSPYEQAVQATYIKDLKNRFANKIFQDPLVRAARDPIRKLNPEERFIGLARLIKDTDIEQEGIIALAIAACLRYYNSNDKESEYLQYMIKRQGAGEVLRDICNIDPESRLGRLIIEKYAQFEEFGVAYSGLTLVNPKPTEGTTHIVMGFDGVVANTNPILRRHFAYIFWKIVNGITDDDRRKPTETELSEGKEYFDKILGRRFVGDVIQDVIELAKTRGVNPERLKSAKKYLNEYRKRRKAEIGPMLKSKPETLLTPGIKELLIELEKLNKKIRLLTKAHPKRVKEIVKKEDLGLKEHFRKILWARDLRGKIEMLRQFMFDNQLKPSNVIFIDDSPWVIDEARKKIGEDLHIVAIREEVGENDRELYSSANFILDNFIPSKNKLSIFLKTKGLTVPRRFSFQKQTRTTTGPINIEGLDRERKSTEQIDSAA